MTVESISKKRPVLSRKSALNAPFPTQITRTETKSLPNQGKPLTLENLEAAVKAMANQPIREAISELLEVIRGRQPGIDSLKAKKLSRKFARELSLYFRQLGRNLPFRDLPGYLKRNAVIKEQADDEALRMAANATEAMNQRLDSIMRKNIETGFLLGANQAHQIFRIEPTFDLLDDGAVRFLNSRTDFVLKKINEETTEQIAQILTRGARAGDSPARLARRIKTEIADWSDIKVGTIKRGRAQLIANTELNNAMSEASLQTYTRLGIAAKSWSTVGDDDVSDDCQDNEAAGPIPMDETFPGGVGRPPQHPGCRCTLVPERMGAPEPTGVGT